MTFTHQLNKNIYIDKLMRTRNETINFIHKNELRLRIRKNYFKIRYTLIIVQFRLNICGAIKIPEKII